MHAQYRFRFSEDHLITSFVRFRQQARWRRLFLAMRWVASVALALLFAFAVYTGAKVSAAILGGVLGAVLSASLLGWRIDAWLIRKRFRKSPFHDDEITAS